MARSFADLEELPIVESMTDVQKDTWTKKYKRDDATFAETSMRVAHNLALAELLYIPEFRDQIFEGVSHKIVENNDGSSMYLLHSGLPNVKLNDAQIKEDLESLVAEDGDAAQRVNEYVTDLQAAAEQQVLNKDYDILKNNFQKFIGNLEQIYDSDEKARGIVNETRKEFNDVFSSLNFIPNSPTIMNAGRELQQLSGCYVMNPEDTMPSWKNIIGDAMMIHKSGGGTGFALSNIRPRGDKVGPTPKAASGAVSFIRILNSATEEVKQGGARRGANMGVLAVNHPDLLEFIDYKTEYETLLKEDGTTEQRRKIENFNFSVGITEEWYQKAKAREDFPLINPRTGEIWKDPETGKEVILNAGEIWDKIISNAHKCGDPGFVFLDRLNDPTANPTPHVGEVQSTNPCGEQPLLSYESCNLGSINLEKYIVEVGDKKEVDWSGLEKTVYTAVHFLDNVIDMNCYPLPIIEKTTKGNRKIGLGVMGWADMLANLGIGYNTKEARAKAEEVMGFINNRALDASTKLAEKRGIFPNWDGSVYDSTSEYFDGRSVKPRNAGRTTIAPTGTIGLLSGAVGGGIEPIFSLVQRRIDAEGADLEKKGLPIPPEHEHFIYFKPFFELAEKEKFWGKSEKELYDAIKNNHQSINGLDFIPETVQEIFATSHDVDSRGHVGMQGAYQKHTDHAVSKTVNLPKNATEKDIERVYDLAFEEGCAGVTVYRDGSLGTQILSTGAGGNKSTLELKINEPLFIQSDEDNAPSTNRKINTTSFFGEETKPAYITISFMKQGWRGEKLNEFIKTLDDTMSEEERLKKLKYYSTDYPDGRSFQIFLEQGKPGEVAAAHRRAFGKLMSKGLQIGIPPQAFYKTLNGIQSNTQAILKEDGKIKIYKSVEDFTSKLFKEYIQAIGEPLDLKEVKKFYEEKGEPYPYIDAAYSLADSDNISRYRIKLDDESKLYMFLTPSKEGPLGEVFFSRGKAGGDQAAHAESLARLVALDSRYGMHPSSIVNCLKGIKSTESGREQGAIYGSLEEIMGSKIEKWYQKIHNLDIHADYKERFGEDSVSLDVGIANGDANSTVSYIGEDCPGCGEDDCSKRPNGGKGCFVYDCGYETGACNG